MNQGRMMAPHERSTTASPAPQKPGTPAASNGSALAFLASQVHATNAARKAGIHWRDQIKARKAASTEQQPAPTTPTPAATPTPAPAAAAAGATTAPTGHRVPQTRSSATVEVDSSTASSMNRRSPHPGSTGPVPAALAASSPTPCSAAADAADLVGPHRVPARRPQHPPAPAPAAPLGTQPSDRWSGFMAGTGAAAAVARAPPGTHSHDSDSSDSEMSHDGARLHTVVWQKPGPEAAAAATDMLTPPTSTAPAARTRSRAAGRPNIHRARMSVMVAPGSPVDAALRSHPKPEQRKLHRPRALKKISMGTEAYYRQKAEKLQGKHINAQHTLYHLSYGMMVGIFTSVQSVTSADKLSLDDFMKVRKLTFPPGGSDSTQPHALSETFKMKDYAPKVFHALRERFGIDRDDYMASLGGAYQYIEFQSNSKSGQFFFFSHDGKYMIKTQTKEESKFLRRILLHYFKHCTQNPGTFLPRFYGMHRLKMKHLDKKVHFVVMHSVFDSVDLNVHEMYDVKGSTVGREATEAEKSRGLSKCVLKDNDMTAMGTSIRLGPVRRAAFLEQIQRDSDFLRQMKIMDYSLLLGIHFRNREEDGVHSAERHASPPPARSGSRGRASIAPGSGSLPDATGGRAASRLPRGSNAWSGHGAATFSDEDLRYFPGSCEAVPSDDGRGHPGNAVYFMGIIDILQQYNLRKTGESFLRGLVHKRSEVSAVSPAMYATRFVEFLADHSS